jgi:hypothetical protein
MKLVRFAGIAVVALALSAMVFFPGRPASGQPGTPMLPASPYYAGNFAYRYPGQDPEMLKIFNEEAKVEREAAGLIRDYARSDKEEERDKIKGKLSDVLGKVFNLQQKRRDLELARLEAQVKKLKDLMKKRTEARQTIIDKRLDQLIREAEGLGWTAPPGPGFPKGPPNAFGLPAATQPQTR